MGSLTFILYLCQGKTIIVSSLLSRLELRVLCVNNRSRSIVRITIVGRYVLIETQSCCFSLDNCETGVYVKTKEQ